MRTLGAPRAIPRPTRAWLRPGPLGGLAFVVIIAISFLPGIPPGVDDPEGEVASWFVGKRSEILAANYLTGFALFAFAFFLGGVHAALRRAEASEDDGFAAVALVGGVAFVTMTLAGVALFNALAFNVAEQGDGAVVRGLWDLLHFVFIAGGFGIAILVAAVAAGGRRMPHFPRWFTRAGAALTLLWMFAGVAFLSDDAVLGPGGFVWAVAFTAFCGWVLTLSVLMALAPGADS